MPCYTWGPGQGSHLNRGAELGPAPPAPDQHGSRAGVRISVLPRVPARMVVQQTLHSPSGAPSTSPLLSWHWAPLTALSPASTPLSNPPCLFCGSFGRRLQGLSLSPASSLPRACLHCITASVSLGPQPCAPAAHRTLPLWWLFGLTRVPAVPACVSHCLLSL